MTQTSITARRERAVWKVVRFDSGVRTFTSSPLSSTGSPQDGTRGGFFLIFLSHSGGRWPTVSPVTCADGQPWAPGCGAASLTSSPMRPPSLWWWRAGRWASSTGSYSCSSSHTLLGQLFRLDFYSCIIFGVVFFSFNFCTFKPYFSRGSIISVNLQNHYFILYIIHIPVESTQHWTLIWLSNVLLSKKLFAGD